MIKFSSPEERDRPLFLMLGAAVAALFLMLGLIMFPSEGRASVLLFDLTGKLGVYPFTMQSLMWLMFFLALADATYIYLLISKDKAGLAAHFLPEGKTKMISDSTAKHIYKSISTGGQQTSAKHIDFSTLFQSLGIKKLFKAESIIDLKNCLNNFLSSDGPSFLELKVQPGSRKGLGRPTIKPVKNKKDFMNFLDE